jgi:hypothetical protein
MSTRGLDHANGYSPPNPAAIIADGNAFVYRYVAGSMDSFWTKVIRKPELDGLWNAGVQVGLVFERGTGQDYFYGQDGKGGGYAGGQYWAQQQKAVNHAIGWPDSWPIVVAADWDFTNGGPTNINPPSTGEKQCQKIAEFQRGWATVLAEPGLYGGYFTLGAVKRLHPALTLGWQTVAWSYLNRQLFWQPWAQVHQMVGTRYVGGTGCDVNYCFGAPNGLHLRPNTPPVPTPTGPFAGWEVLRVGSTGGRVAQWQKVLNALNAKPKLVVDGQFGPATAARTKDLQKLASIAQDGIAGPATYLAAQFFMALSKIDINKL